MARLISVVLVCLLCFDISCVRLLASTGRAHGKMSKSQLAQAAGASSTSPSAYENVIEQLCYACSKQLPDPKVLAQMENDIAAADASSKTTSAARLAAQNPSGQGITISDLASACTRNAALKNVVDSYVNTFTTGQSSADTATYISNLYQNLLNRQPSAAELAYWSQAIDSGAATRGQIALAMLSGPEYINDYAANVDKNIQALKATQASQNTNTASTNANHPPESGNNGFYVGVNVGATFAKNNIKVDTTTSSTSSASTSSTTNSTTESASEPSVDSGLFDKVKTFIQNHPYITTVAALTAVAIIATAIVVPIAVVQCQNAQSAANRQNQMNQQAILTYFRQLTAGRTVTTVTAPYVPHQ